MGVKILLAAFAVLFQYEFAAAQSQTNGYVPNPMSAAELWNPYAWYYPFAIASAESYRDYFLRAQDATNKLYYQAYQSNAYPWITGYGTRAPYNNLYPTTAGTDATTQGAQTTESSASTASTAASTTQATQATEATQSPQST